MKRGSTYQPSKKARRFGRWAMQMRSPDSEVRKEAERRLREGQEFRRRREGAGLWRPEVAEEAGVDPEDLLAYERGQLPPEECPPDFVERIEAALERLAARA